MGLNTRDYYGNQQVLPNGGVDPAFRVTFEILAAAMPTAVDNDLITLQMPSNNANLARLKRVRATRRLDGTHTNATNLVLQVVKRAAPDTGTAATTPTPVPLDPKDGAATTVVSTFNTTSAATTAAAAQVLDEIVLSGNTTTVGSLVSTENVKYTDAGDKAPMLRGPAQLTTADQLSIRIASTFTTTTGEVYAFMVEFDEAPLAVVTPLANNPG